MPEQQLKREMVKKEANQTFYLCFYSSLSLYLCTLLKVAICCLCCMFSGGVQDQRLCLALGLDVMDAGMCVEVDRNASRNRGDPF